ncbi:hypothetical protein FNV43_RR11420 [Rhamnella rubrinervis]|uniref:BOS complex subunit TMEM147 n=1 Tax=Rhamnella rubrinervis TaxID=2594499 RepID=A0A8K0MHL3_9ROSA|nr:hypothetical protein FNV43_RR11420 [Rhamnella rubrinervis]
MTVFHFFNCAILTFGPHAVYYSATPLSEYDTLGTSVKAALVYLGTALVKLVCLATFLKVSETDSFDPYQELLKALIGFIDVAGLYFALTQLTHRNISQNHKFQAVGLGWAFADSVLHRLAPLWVGARGLEFTWDYILQGLEANANLVLSISLAALGSLMWLRKNKPKTLIPIIYACAGIVATMPSITSYLRRGLGWHFPKVVGFELFTSLLNSRLNTRQSHLKSTPHKKQLQKVKWGVHELGASENMVGLTYNGAALSFYGLAFHNRLVTNLSSPCKHISGN